MITLSYRQPMPTLIALGIKPIENRTWKLPEKYKGKRVLIHASGKPWSWKQFCEYIESLDNDDLELQQIIRENNFSEKWIKSLPTSAIIGSVVYTGSTINHPSIWAEKTPLKDAGFSPSDGWLLVVPDLSKVVYNWVCKEPILFKEPILNVKGKLNFWNYNPGIVPPQLISHVLDNEIDTISL